MSPNRKILAKLLSETIAEELDPYLAAHGFRRRLDSLKYARTAGESSQHIEILFDIVAGPQGNRAAFLLPGVRINLPAVNRIAEKMLPRSAGTVSLVRATVFKQIQNAAPQTARGEWGHHVVSDDRGARIAIRVMRGFLSRWTIPFMDEYISPGSLVAGYERNDERLLHDRRFWVIIAAAYCALGDPGGALALLETRFHRPGPRKDYAASFDYVRGLLHDKHP